MTQLPYELAILRRDELLRQASDRRSATQAAASLPAPRATRTPKTLHRFLRLPGANPRVRAGESPAQRSVARGARRLDAGL
jgi:hypothetical protein